MAFLEGRNIFYLSFFKIEKGESEGARLGQSGGHGGEALELQLLRAHDLLGLLRLSGEQTQSALGGARRDLRRLRRAER